MPTVLRRSVNVPISAAFVWVLLLLGPAEARAQVVATSFADLQTLVKPGDTIEVTDANGRRTTGRLGDLSASSLELLVWRTGPSATTAVPQKVVEADVMRITLARGDSLWNGTAIGMGVGLGLGVWFAMVCGDLCTTPVRGVVSSAGIGAAIGLAIDSAKRKKIDVYQRAPAQRISSMRVSPVLSKSAVGIRMSMKF